MLDKSRERSKQSAQMMVLFGRRRIGKTSLALKAAASGDYVYLFVSKKNERLLCQDFVVEIERSLNTEVFGEFFRFRDIFAYLMQQAKTRHFTLIIDEFQEFVHIQPAVFSEIQEIWDRNKQEAKLHLIISGSVHRLMHEIFENSKEPLFGRASGRIHLQAFEPSTMVEIMRDHASSFTHEDLLAVYTVTGGIPKYLELLVGRNCLTYATIRDEIFQQDAYWLDEGKFLLMEEFGKDYQVYFSILSLIASGKTSRTDIESILEKNIGGYLDRLVNDYNLLQVVRPFLARPQSRIQKYEIVDHFLRFWFRFIFKYRASVESKNFTYLKDIFDRDFRSFAGKTLEMWFRNNWREKGYYTSLGNFWEKGGNEIDIVAVNDKDKKVVFAEVKINPDRLSLPVLQQKAEKVLQKLPGYGPEYKLLSLEDMLTT